ncbi:hypothetical protein NUITMVRE32_25130 [Enterococcus faecium]|nr:hypothetical protein NUITMVRE32_25130 [Enterococcus faecium]
MRVVIGSDSDGMELKELIKKKLIKEGITVVDKSETAGASIILCK